MNLSNRSQISAVSLLLLLGIVVLAYLLSISIVEKLKDIQLMIIIMVVFLGSIIFWKKAVILTLYWLTVVGAVRKWLLPELSEYLFFTPHAILLGAYIRFLGDWIIGKYTPIIKQQAINILLGDLVVYGIFNAFNPMHPDLRVGVLGVIVHFYFIPLMFIVPYVFETKEKFINFLKMYSLFSLPLLLLGVKQFFSPVHDPINIYVTKTLDIATTGRFPRVTSTFSYISGYTTYLNFIALIMVYLLSIRKLTRISTLFISFLLPLSIVNLFMTGSRGPVGVTIIAIGLYLMLVLSRTNTGYLRFLPRIILAIGIIFVIFINTEIGKSAYEGFMERATKREDIAPRIVETFRPFKFIEQTGLILTLVGYGIGSTYQGALKFVHDWGDMPRDFEEEPRRIVLELGLIGYILVYSLRLLFLLLSWKIFKTLKDSDLKPLALCSFLYQVQFFHFFNLVFNYTANFYYWFLIGTLYLIIKFDREKTESEATTGSYSTPG
jgi:hypothetical protein